MLEWVTKRPRAKVDPVRQARALLSTKGEASGVALAQSTLDAYEALAAEGRRQFLRTLESDFGADARRVAEAWRKYETDGSPAALVRLHAAAESGRQELFRRMNLAPGGTARLVAMREDLLRLRASRDDLSATDADLQHLFASWFNRGFLELRRIDWQTPAHILEKIIRYEAVHTIRDWNDLRRRVEPPDRRCYAFFHPQMHDEPLIFVEVALGNTIAANIASLLDEPPNDAWAKPSVAVFYSISNCHAGLKGVSFGNFLIKQVVADLQGEFGSLKRFVTLSPVPGFGAWLLRQSRSGSAAVRTAAQVLGDGGAPPSAESIERNRAVFTRAMCEYLLGAKSQERKPLDPVQRFHLDNGAQLERLNWMADRSEKGLGQSAGMMVNYLYDLRHIDRNHEAFVASGTIFTGKPFSRLCR